MKNGKYRKAATFSLSGCPLRGEKSFSQRAFSIYTDIRKLQDKTKTSWMTTVCTSGIAAILYVSLLKNANL